MVALKEIQEQRKNLKNQYSSVETHRGDQKTIKNSWKVPNNLPLFCGGRGEEDPLEFIEHFECICLANGIQQERYVQLVQLCLDKTDVQWITSTIRDSVHTKEEWEKFKVKFIGHFQDPNARRIWGMKIRNLKMDSSGVQRYSDKFLTLMSYLGWDASSDDSIYYFKLGLPRWLGEQVSIAEVTMGEKVSVKDLVCAAIRLEAIKQEREYKGNRNISEKPRFKYGACYKCGELGHKAFECKEQEESHENKEKSISNSRRFGDRKGDLKFRGEIAKDTTTALFYPPVKTSQTLRMEENRGKQEEKICYTCGKPGHTSCVCEQTRNDGKKVVKTLNVEQKENEENSKPIDGIHTPCVINGVSIIALVDPGATILFVDRNFVKENGWTVTPNKGIIRQAMTGSELPCMGEVRNVNIQNGTKDICVTLEVGNLSGDEKVILGLDLFGQLGYTIINIPILFPSSDTKDEQPEKEKISD